MSIQSKVIVFTGRLSRPRHEFQSLVERNGGKFGTSVTKNTDYLVLGESPGSKLAVATQLGTKVVSEREFLDLLESEEEVASAPAPRCPHCDSSAVYVEDFSLHHCHLCGTWFEAPRSPSARKVKHVHMWVQSLSSNRGVRKRCVCGFQALLSYEHVERSKRNYALAPTWVKEWQRRDLDLRVRQIRSQLQREWFDSLSDEQKDELVQRVKSI